MDNKIVDRLRAHATPDPYDEREVLHAPLLKEAATLIEKQFKELEVMQAKLDKQSEEDDDIINSISSHNGSNVQPTSQAEQEMNVDGLSDSVLGKMNKFRFPSA